MLFLSVSTADKSFSFGECVCFVGHVAMTPQGVLLVNIHCSAQRNTNELGHNFGIRVKSKAPKNIIIHFSRAAESKQKACDESVILSRRKAKEITVIEQSSLAFLSLLPHKSRVCSSAVNVSSVFLLLLTVNN